MDIRIFKYFIAIVEAGNISKAAEQLHITQPTLSRQLKEFKLEPEDVDYLEELYVPHPVVGPV